MTQTITEAEIAEGERLLAASAPGPWRQSLSDDTVILTMDSREVCNIDGDYNSPDDWPTMEANAALIVFARNNLPTHLAAARREAALREENAWRPIDDDAKNGDVRLLSDGNYVFCGYWNPRQSHPWHVLDPDVDGVLNGWPEDAVTMWRPLPKPAALEART